VITTRGLDPAATSTRRRNVSGERRLEVDRSTPCAPRAEPVFSPLDEELELAPRLRRRAAQTVLHMPPTLLSILESDAQVVLTGSGVAGPYGWHALRRGEPWALDAYLRPQALQILFDEVAAVADQADEADGMAVLLRTVEGDWPFPSHYQRTPPPLAALDLLDYSDSAVRRLGRQVLGSPGDTAPTVVARRTARARVTAGPFVGKLLRVARDRGPRPVVEGNARTDTEAAGGEHRRRALGNPLGRAPRVVKLRAAIGWTSVSVRESVVITMSSP
jgi:hypothetical protein